VRYPDRDTFPMGKELAAHGINRKVSSLPAYLRENEVTQFRAGYTHVHVYREYCVHTADDARADAVWLIKIAADIGLFY